MHLFCLFLGVQSTANPSIYREYEFCGHLDMLEYQQYCGYLYWHCYLSKEFSSFILNCWSINNLDPQNLCAKYASVIQIENNVENTRTSHLFVLNLLSTSIFPCRNWLWISTILAWVPYTSTKTGLGIFLVNSSDLLLSFFQYTDVLGFPAIVVPQLLKNVSSFLSYQPHATKGILIFLPSVLVQVKLEVVVNHFPLSLCLLVFLLNLVLVFFWCFQTDL